MTLSPLLTSPSGGHTEPGNCTHTHQSLVVPHRRKVYRKIPSLVFNIITTVYCNNLLQSPSPSESNDLIAQNADNVCAFSIMEYRYLYGGRTTSQGMKGPIVRFQTLRSPGILMGLPVPESEMLEETNQCLRSRFRFFPATAGSYKPNFFFYPVAESWPLQSRNCD